MASDSTTYAEITETHHDLADLHGEQTPAPSADILTIPTSAPTVYARSRSQEQPIYASVQKKRRAGSSEFLHEDIIYWKVLKPKSRKSYSAERLRSHSPVNLLDAEERDVLARSVSPFTLDKRMRKQKSEYVTRTRGQVDVRAKDKPSHSWVRGDSDSETRDMSTSKGNKNGGSYLGY